MPTQVLLALVLFRGNWGELVSPSLSAAELAKVMTGVSAGFQIALISAVVILVIDSLLQIRILRSGRSRPVAVWALL
jgi:hypothetical protein